MLNLQVWIPVSLESKEDMKIFVGPVALEFSFFQLGSPFQPAEDKMSGIVAL